MQGRTKVPTIGEVFCDGERHLTSKIALVEMVMVIEGVMVQALSYKIASMLLFFSGKAVAPFIHGECMVQHCFVTSQFQSGPEHIKGQCFFYFGQNGQG